MVDAKKYREKGTKVVTTKKTDTTFTVRRMSPLTLVEMLAEAGIRIEAGKKPDIDPIKGAQIARMILPECVDEVVERGEGTDEFLEVNELDLDDAMELFHVAMDLAGVKDKEIVQAEEFRDPPVSAGGGPHGEDLPGSRRPDGPSETPDA